MRQDRVIILGAGAAGLLAALDLREAGVEPIVLEARDRVGGRAHTVRFPGGRWANAGAEWVNTGHWLVRQLAATYQLELVSGRGFEALVVDGELRRDNPEGIEIITEAIERLGANLADLDEPWNDPAAVALDGRNVASWLDELQAPHLVRASFEAYIRGEFMVEPGELSLAALALGERLEVNDTAFRFADGTAALLQAMAADLGGERTHLNEAVTRVTQDSAMVSMETTRTVYEAGAVILTAPLPALDSITFSPTLDLPSVGQGRGGKLLMPYPNRPWNAADANGPGHRASTPREARFDFVYESAPGQPGPGGVLAAYGMEVLGEAEVQEAFAAWFAGLGTTDAPSTAAWWSEEPESRTTYSAFAPGFLPALARLREPFGRVHLAGEYTEIVNGFLESALRSGRRVAQRWS